MSFPFWDYNRQLSTSDMPGTLQALVYSTRQCLASGIAYILRRDVQLQVNKYLIIRPEVISAMKWGKGWNSRGVIIWGWWVRKGFSGGDNLNRIAKWNERELWNYLGEEYSRQRESDARTLRWEHAWGCWRNSNKTHGARVEFSSRKGSWVAAWGQVLQDLARIWGFVMRLSAVIGRFWVLLCFLYFKELHDLVYNLKDYLGSWIDKDCRRDWSGSRIRC